MFFKPENDRTGFAALTFILTSAIVTGVLTFALTGDTLQDFLAATAYTLNYAQSKGLGSFYFYWTLNSLALFALLSLAVVIVGMGLPKALKTPMQYGGPAGICGTTICTRLITNRYSTC